MSADAAQLHRQLDDAESVLRRHWKRSPKFGVVLGTGAGELATAIEVETVVEYQQLPYFPASTAIGHQGQLVCGQLAEKNVVAMQGRFHLYEGYSVDQATFPIHLMRRLGVETLFVSNASGGINPNFRSGEIMLIESHIDLMHRSTPAPPGSAINGRPLGRSDCYDQNLIQDAMAVARVNGFPIRRGVYAAMLGPNYETRSEYRMLRKIGADAAGMSTVPEVTVAAKYGMRVLGMSIISNVANPDALQSTSGQEVVSAAAAAAGQLRLIVENAIQTDDR